MGSTCTPKQVNFYPRPPRGGRPAILAINKARQTISTHALREEGDAGLPGFPVDSGGFLPTPSARRATPPVHVMALLPAISTHALREEGDSWPRFNGYLKAISTHALREEGDAEGVVKGTITSGISTHALREEGDAQLFQLVYVGLHFYPRPPRGGRP